MVAYDVYQFATSGRKDRTQAAGYLILDIVPLRFGRAAEEVARRWRVGDDIYATTHAGKDPAWSTVRERYWKNAAAQPGAAERYGSENLPRMRRGRAPQRPNPDAPKGVESLELSHEPTPLRRGGRALRERWPCEHALVDPYRNPGYC
jgi:hypothetical protein